MFKNLLTVTLCGLFVLMSSGNFNAATITYQLAPKQSITLTNPLYQEISPYCLIQAVSSVTSTLSISMLQGRGVFNGTSIAKGGTSFQNVYNSQYIPITASQGASARIANIGTYAILAQCTLD